MDLCKVFRNIKPVKWPTGLEVQNLYTFVVNKNTKYSDSGNGLTLTKNKAVATGNPKIIILNVSLCLDLCFRLEVNIWNASVESRVGLKELRFPVNWKPFHRPLLAISNWQTKV